MRRTMDKLNYLIEKIRLSSREIVRELGLLSKEGMYNLPLPFRYALIELESHGSLTHIELASLLQLDKSTVSRLAKSMLNEKLVTINTHSEDNRYKRIFITTAGKKALVEINNIANQQVHDALLQLPDADQQKVVSALDLYAKALKRSRIQNEYMIRKIQKQDNLELMLLIKKVLNEYGADKPGFAFTDPELENMYQAFNNKKSVYFVVVRKKDNKLVGGGGIGLLHGEKNSICELKKMYLLNETRGLGLGYQLLTKLLMWAKENGYSKCYLETIDAMDKANYLYKKCGFNILDKPLGDTGHYGCNVWYIKNLLT